MCSHSRDCSYTAHSPGERYETQAHAIYTDVARQDGVPLIPFLLDGVAGHQEPHLDDGIHPNERGHRIVAQNVWRVLEPLLREQGRQALARNRIALTFAALLAIAVHFVRLKMDTTAALSAAEGGDDEDDHCDVRRTGHSP